MRKLALLLFVVAIPLSGDPIAEPSRPAEKGCTWEKFSSAKLGIDAWVQRCDFGFRKIDFVEQGSSLAVRYSDGGKPEPLIDVFAMNDGEEPADSLRRIFAAGTPEAIATRCVVVPLFGQSRADGIERYTFAPDEEYNQELASKGNGDEVPEPACGPLGDQPDGIQYFEAHPAARKILFLRLGQDTPLFDQETIAVK